MTVCYVAGPYTQGVVQENVNKAIDAGHLLMDFGFTPIVPHLSHYAEARRSRPYSDWLRADCELIQRCDVVLRIPGYSPGADKECALAEHFGLPVCHSVEEVVARFGRTA